MHYWLVMELGAKTLEVSRRESSRVASGARRHNEMSRSFFFSPITMRILYPIVRVIECLKGTLGQPQVERTAPRRETSQTSARE